MKTIKDKELDSLFQKVLPPEEFGEDQAKNEITDLKAEIERLKGELLTMTPLNVPAQIVVVMKKN